MRSHGFINPSAFLLAAGSAGITLSVRAQRVYTTAANRRFQVTLGPPFVNGVYFLRLYTGAEATPSWPANSTIHFGLLGWTNSAAHFGYDIRTWGGPGFSYVFPAK